MVPARKGGQGQLLCRRGETGPGSGSAQRRAGQARVKKAGEGEVEGDLVRVRQAGEGDAPSAEEEEALAAMWCETWLSRAAAWDVEGEREDEEAISTWGGRAGVHVSEVRGRGRPKGGGSMRAVHCTESGSRGEGRVEQLQGKRRRAAQSCAREASLAHSQAERASEATRNLPGRTRLPGARARAVGPSQPVPPRADEIPHCRGRWVIQCI